MTPSKTILKSFWVSQPITKAKLFLSLKPRAPYLQKAGKTHPGTNSAGPKKTCGSKFPTPNKFLTLLFVYTRSNARRDAEGLNLSVHDREAVYDDGQRVISLYNILQWCQWSRSSSKHDGMLKTLTGNQNRKMKEGIAVYGQSGDFLFVLSIMITFKH